jgi:hypothetical protein
MGEEWAITSAIGVPPGHYWNGSQREDGGWGPLNLKGRHANYYEAAAEVARLRDHSLRIVPAPPREMTDADAEAWLSERYSYMVFPTKFGGAGNLFGCGPSGPVSNYGYGPTIYDAIRAARKKLERP